MRTPQAGDIYLSPGKGFGPLVVTHDGNMFYARGPDMERGCCLPSDLLEYLERHGYLLHTTLPEVFRGLSKEILR